MLKMINNFYILAIGFLKNLSKGFLNCILFLYPSVFLLDILFYNLFNNFILFEFIINSNYEFGYIFLYTLFSSDASQSIVFVKSYDNADTMRLQILNENKGKTGIEIYLRSILRDTCTCVFRSMGQ